MKIFELSTFDNKGGAAKLAYQLKNGLRSRGFGVSMVVGKKYSTDQDVYELPRTFLQRIFNNRYIQVGGLGASTLAQIEKLGLSEVDVVHIHNVHGGYSNLQDIVKIFHRKPSVWTLHDPWLVQFAGKTQEYDNLFNESRALISLKQKIVQVLSNCALVAPSLWLKNIVRAALPQANIELVYNGVDTNVYHQVSKIEARKKIELPLNKKILLFVANGGVTNIFKGGEILSLIKQYFNKCEVVVLGDKKYISDEVVMNLYYNAADVLIYPSLVDNFPLTILEAMASGLPVVTFATGGIPEVVTHCKTGYVAAYQDSEDFLQGIRYMLNLPASKIGVMSNDAIASIKERFLLDSMIKKYIEIYESKKVK